MLSCTQLGSKMSFSLSNSSGDQGLVKATKENKKYKKQNKRQSLLVLKHVNCKYTIQFLQSLSTRC